MGKTFHCNANREFSSVQSISDVAKQPSLLGRTATDLAAGGANSGGRQIFDKCRLPLGSNRFTSHPQHPRIPCHLQIPAPDTFALAVQQLA